MPGARVLHMPGDENAREQTRRPALGAYPSFGQAAPLGATVVANGVYFSLYSSTAGRASLWISRTWTVRSGTGDEI